MEIQPTNLCLKGGGMLAAPAPFCTHEAWLKERWCCNCSWSFAVLNAYRDRFSRFFKQSRGYQSLVDSRDRAFCGGFLAVKPDMQWRYVLPRPENRFAERQALDLEIFVAGAFNVSLRARRFGRPLRSQRHG